MLYFDMLLSPLAARIPDPGFSVPPVKLYQTETAFSQAGTIDEQLVLPRLSRFSRLI